jgi:hypothetical protein
MSSFIRAWFPVFSTVLIIPGPGPAVAAQERQAVEPAERKGDPVFSAVEERTTVLSLKPAGARVARGELVCELEAFPVREKLASQERTTKAAEAPCQSARLAREVAELAVREYLEGIFKQQLQKIEGEISLADSKLKRAEEQLAAAKRLVEKGIRPRSYVEANELNVQRARLALDQAQGKKVTLEKYTKERTVKGLQGAVEKARAQELVVQAALAREQAVQDQLKKQIESCKVLAPVNGRLLYPRGIEEGAEVSKGQLLFRVVPEEEPKEGAK